jgi:DNA polymerase III alpha subunit
MTYRLVESFEDDFVITIGKRTFPSECLVEDDDAIRILITSSTEISGHVWARSHAAGAAALLLYKDDATFAFMLAERFIENREEHQATGTYRTKLSQWTNVEGPVEYRQMTPDVAHESSLSAPGRGFVHLHAHSEYSALDGLSKVEEMVDAVVADDQPALAVTDHGVCAAHPDLQKIATKAGIKPIFGIEAYFVDDRHQRAAEDKTETKRDYQHLVLWAMNDKGLHNLWAMSTEANREGFYYKPRMDWDVLTRLNEGVMCSTACLRGPLADALLAQDEPLALQRLGRLLDIFGDRLYIELQTNNLAEQKTLNELLITVARQYSVPMIAAVDAHYPTFEDRGTHRAWIASQTSGDLTDDPELFAGNADYHMMRADEVAKALDYLPEDVVTEAMSNTVAVAERCDAQVKTMAAHAPIFSKKGGVDADRDRLADLCLKNWHRKITNRNPSNSFEVYEERFVREMDLLERKQFCGYFLMVADYCLDPSTPVLTEDLRWVEVGKLEIGDRLVGFDEHKVLKNKKAHRYWHATDVLRTRRLVLPTYKVRLEDGTETITSEDHQWLIASPCEADIRWVRTKDLKVGQRPQRLVSEWAEPDTWEAGYIAGILDGEGSLSLSKMHNGGHSLSLGFAQKEGVVLDTALRILDSWGFDYSLKNHGKERNSLWSVWLRGGRAEVIRLLGIARPQRLLAKLDVELLGRVISIDRPAIVSVEALGLGEVVALETTTGTLVAQGFAHHNCRYAKEHGILVGPGRGSGGGSLVAYLADITELDPIESNLMFERFLTEGRTALPDFDVDFPSKKRDDIQNYIRDRWGEDYVVRVGTTTRLKNKAVVRSVARVLKGTEEIFYPDIDAISKIIEEAEADSAGLGISWDELWSQHGDVLMPYREKYPMLFDLCEKMVGRVRSYGKHAAGLVISTETPLTDALPMRNADGLMVAEFDMHALEDIGLVKFDILTLRTLDTVQMTIDLIKEQTGEAIDIYSWGKEQYEDERVWEEVAQGNTLGIFQIETRAGTQLTKRFKPRSMHELADVITLVRPGPVRSGLTETYFRRKAGNEPISVPDPRLEKVLDRTFGCLIYQEDIIATCMILAGYSSAEADEVRSILGKKKVEQTQKAGEKFIAQCVVHGMAEEAAAGLWAQMAEFAKYSFNRAHAFGYAELGFWTAWLKVIYPIEFLTAVLSTVDKDRIPDFINEARRMGYKVLPPDINESGSGFKAGKGVVRYGLDSVKGVGAAAVAAITEAQPYTSFEDFMERKGRAANVGVVKTLASVGAFDSLVPNRRELEGRLDWQSSDAGSDCVFKDITFLGPNGLPCHFDWDSEPAPVGKSGKTLKRKPLPKKCSRACRNYTAPVFDPSAVIGYTPADIREREKELLGVYLSSTPFEQIDEKVLKEECATAEIVESGPEGEYVIAATLSKVKPWRDRNDKEMGFIGLFAQTGDIDVTVFKGEWRKYKKSFRMGQLCFAIIYKRIDSEDEPAKYQLVQYMPLD